MATSNRHDAVEGKGQGQLLSSSGMSRAQPNSQGGASPSPLKTKARQVQRRYRSLFHQAAREYQGWCKGEEDSQRALGSVCHMLDRLRMLEPGRHPESDGTLGGLANLPDCRTLLIRKHMVELERVMRLWRALVQQMKAQVSRVEEALAEAWQIHRFDATTCVGQPETPDSKNVQPREAVSPAAAVASAAEAKGGSSVGPAEYLQWLGDMSSMLVHEQWRKEELLSKVDFCPEASSVQLRAHVQAQWSSRSADSFLDRTLIDTTLGAAQVVPLAKGRS